MALFSIGKKSIKDKKEEVVENKKTAVKKENKPKAAKNQEAKPLSVVAKSAALVNGVAVAKGKKEPKVASLVLRHAHITEKASMMAKDNQYIFRVFPRANKSEVKKAVKEVYGVDVIVVKIINVPKKRRRLGRSVGWKSGYKKAIVTVKQGQTIDLLPR